jgi:hypothetical protein
MKRKRRGEGSRREGEGRGEQEGGEIGADIMRKKTGEKGKEG